MSQEEGISLRDMRKKSRQERLHRAASLGPDFFVAVLNALCKAGKTGLTERVWLLAKQAERISWVAGDIPPWFLPCACIYYHDAVLCCRGLRKGLAMVRTRRRRVR